MCRTGKQVGQKPLEPKTPLPGTRASVLTPLTPGAVGHRGPADRAAGDRLWQCFSDPLPQARRPCFLGGSELRPHPAGCWGLHVALLMTGTPARGLELRPGLHPPALSKVHSALSSPLSHGLWSRRRWGFHPVTLQQCQPVVILARTAVLTARCRYLRTLAGSMYLTALMRCDVRRI